MNTEQKLLVTNIQRFCMHDGPGVRTTVYLKGCPLRCEWCHNPETQKIGAEILFYQKKCIGCKSCVNLCKQGAHIIENEHTFDRTKCISCFECSANCPTSALELCGKSMSINKILSIVKSDQAFYGKNGGITLSGGEPFSQNQSAIVLLKACKETGLHTAIETCGYTDKDTLCQAIPFVDLFLWDLKDTNNIRHKQYTGVSNEKILNNLSIADANGANIRLRCILVNGVNTEEEHYRKIAEIASSLSH
ncbi:MAG: glycyl-radical enzyme activating protein, partial [Clostridia bacterium]|nr:glycyl-radical enzyme activating protein [Clostridia bacterium]